MQSETNDYDRRAPHGKRRWEEEETSMGILYLVTMKIRIGIIDDVSMNTIPNINFDDDLDPDSRRSQMAFGELWARRVCIWIRYATKWMCNNESYYFDRFACICLMLMCVCAQSRISSVRNHISWREIRNSRELVVVPCICTRKVLVGRRLESQENLKIFSKLHWTLAAKLIYWMISYFELKSGFELFTLNGGFSYVITMSNAVTVTRVRPVAAVRGKIQGDAPSLSALRANGNSIDHFSLCLSFTHADFWFIYCSIRCGYFLYLCIFIHSMPTQRGQTCCRYKHRDNVFRIQIQ